MHKGNNRAYVTLRDESRDISGKREFSGMNFVVPVTPEFSVERNRATPRRATDSTSR